MVMMMNKFVKLEIDQITTIPAIVFKFIYFSGSSVLHSVFKIEIGLLMLMKQSLNLVVIKKCTKFVHKMQ